MLLFFNRKYSLNASTIRPNDMISFSIAGIHSDPAYYPNPDTFNPDNFSKEARHTRNP